MSCPKYIFIFNKGGETQKLPLQRHYNKKIRKLTLPRPPISKNGEKKDLKNLKVEFYPKKGCLF